MAVFTWVEDKGSDITVEPRVSSAKFGDGYEQRAPNGLNHMMNSVKVTFSLLDATTYDEILTFLEDHQGVNAFDWTPHGRSAGRYVCRKWDHSKEFVGRISATFEQVPA